MSDTMFGSLIVQARPIEVAEVRGRPLAEAGEAVDDRRRRPSRPRPATQRGVVKWWNVTTGSTPVLAARRAHAAGSGRARPSRTRPPRARCGSTRSRSGRCRTPARRRSASRRDSGGSWSHASPLGSTHASRRCSHSHQSLFQLPPSTWCAAVAVPHRKPAGKAMLGSSRCGFDDEWRGEAGHRQMISHVFDRVNYP